MSIEQIKQRLKELRSQRQQDIMSNSYAYVTMEDKLQNELLDIGFCLVWVEHMHDYGVLCNEEE